MDLDGRRAMRLGFSYAEHALAAGSLFRTAGQHDFDPMSVVPGEVVAAVRIVVIASVGRLVAVPSSTGSVAAARLGVVEWVRAERLAFPPSRATGQLLDLARAPLVVGRGLASLNSNRRVRLAMVGGRPPYGRVPQIRAQCLVGQKSLLEEQRLLAASPPDIVVCTPGRLAEHFLGRDATLDLGALRWFVVDEADRLLTQTYHRWLDVLDRVCGEPSAGGNPGFRTQKLLLSATMTWDPRKLAALKLRRPLYFFSSKTGQHVTPASLRQHYVRCRTAAKPLACLHLLRKVLSQSQAP
ncbi:unnamed protein product, partial [Polarella glacialis]